MPRPGIVKLSPMVLPSWRSRSLRSPAQGKVSVAVRVFWPHGLCLGDLFAQISPQVVGYRNEDPHDLRVKLAAGKFLYLTFCGGDTLRRAIRTV